MAKISVRRAIAKILPGSIFIDEIIVILDCVIIVCLLLLAAIPQISLFSVDASVDRLVIDTEKGGTAIAWGEQSVSIPSSAQGIERDCDAWTYNPSLLQSAARVTISTSGTGIVADLSSLDKKSLGELICSDGRSSVAPSRLIMAWPEDKATSLVLPISGKLILGAVPPADTLTAKVVQKGEVSMESRAFSTFSGNARSTYPLTLGDELRIVRAGETADAYTLVQLVEGHLHIVARAKGDHAEISRFGQERVDPAVISPSLFDKIRSQAGWETILILVAITMHLLATISRIADSSRTKAK